VEGVGASSSSATRHFGQRYRQLCAQRDRSAEEVGILHCEVLRLCNGLEERTALIEANLAELQPGGVDDDIGADRCNAAHIWPAQLITAVMNSFSCSHVAPAALGMRFSTVAAASSVAACCCAASFACAADVTSCGHFPLVSAELQQRPASRAKNQVAGILRAVVALHLRACTLLWVPSAP
jgi:hypothetical protein